jgi:uncharacterized protein with FMN-binding domain
MKGFMIKFSSFLVILAALAVYNETLDTRAKTEEIARLNAQLEALEELVPGGQETGEPEHYADGTWEGEGTGFGGTIRVRVTIKEEQITEVTILSADKEDNAYLATAKNILPSFVEAQSANVDTIAGATFSSEGIREAVAAALKEAGN